MIPLRLLIIAADPLARAGVAALLTDQPTLMVVGQVGPEVDFPAQLAAYRPDIVLWDLGWNPATTLERLADFSEIGPPILALAPADGPVRDIWATGVRGVLRRAATSETLAAALQAISQGLLVIEPALSPTWPFTTAPTENFVEPLTPREREVLQALANGLANKQIARQLEISEHTVKFHINAILSKLGAQSRTEAVVRATRAGLILL